MNRPVMYYTNMLSLILTCLYKMCSPKCHVLIRKATITSVQVFGFNLSMDPISQYNTSMIWEKIEPSTIAIETKTPCMQRQYIGSLMINDTVTYILTAWIGTRNKVSRGRTHDNWEKSQSCITIEARWNNMW